MTRKFLITAALAFGSISTTAIAQSAELTQNPAEVRSGSYVLDTEHGKITWSVDHMGFSTYVGQFSEVSATLQLDTSNPSASTLEAEIKTGSIGSFHAELDKHLNGPDFLDTANHPTARFKANEIRLTGEKTAEITGDLTLRGITRPVVMAAVFNQAGPSPADGKYTIGFDGRAQIKRSEFGSTFALPILGDNVTLHFEAEFKLQDENAEE